MKTCRVRRSRPSMLALALALAMTMLIVYLATVSAREPSAARNVQTASAETGSAEVPLRGMETCFLTDCVCSDELSARVSAAKCAQNGGAGFVLPVPDGYAVIRDTAADAASADAVSMRADELTLRLSGRARDVAAVSSAAEFLYGQAAQTGALAGALDAGETDADSVRALLNVYWTQGRQTSEALSRISGGGDAVNRIAASVSCALERLDSAIRETSAAKMRLIHAAGCAEWISLLNDLSEL